MPVRKRGDAWCVRVQINGSRIERSLGRGSTKTDALALEAQIRRDAIAGKVRKAPARTVEDALLRWLEGEAKSLKSYNNLLSKVRAIRPYCLGIKLSDAVAVAERIKDESRQDGLAPATINRRLAILRRICNLAFQQWGWLDNDIGKRIKLVTGEKHRHIYLTPEQVDTLAGKCEHPRVADAIRLASMSGLREGELLGLTAESKRDGCLVLTETKNGKPRIVPLPPEADAIDLPLGIGYSTLRTYFERARADAGLPHIRFHDLRHTYASWLIQGGASLVAVRDLLGHSNLAVTSRYSHLATDHLRDAVKMMGQKRGNDKLKAKKNNNKALKSQGF